MIDIGNSESGQTRAKFHATSRDMRAERGREGRRADGARPTFVTYCHECQKEAHPVKGCHRSAKVKGGGFRGYIGKNEKFLEAGSTRST